MYFFFSSFYFKYRFKIELINKNNIIKVKKRYFYFIKFNNERRVIRADVVKSGRLIGTDLKAVLQKSVSHERTCTLNTWLRQSSVMLMDEQSI